MRVKNALTMVPVPNIFRVLFERITVSRIALFYFCFSLVYCIALLVFQSWAFKINNQAGLFLRRIIDVSGINDPAVVAANGQVAAATGPAFLQDNLTPTDSLLVSTPTLTPTSTSSSSRASALIASSTSRPSTSAAARPTRTPTYDPNETERDDSGTKDKRFTKRDDKILRIDRDGVKGVFVSFLLDEGQPGAFLGEVCVNDLMRPAWTIHNTKREDVTFMAFQVWVMGMTIIALLNESIPHLIAAFLTHILATAWSGFQIYNTHQFRQDFQQATSKAESCDTNVLPNYWSQRNAAEIAVLSINAVFLVSSIFFTYRLAKTFGWQTFKRIGASLEINRIYKLVLVFSIGLQLAFFCVIASMGLWVDLIQTTDEGKRATNATLYQALAIIVCILMVPWMYLGWTSVRKESRTLMGVFILVSILMMGGWGGLFVSTTFRQTFVNWGFFASISAASCLFALMCTILGAICLRNFNKGLKHFLNAEEQLPGEDFAPVTQDPEKSSMVQFPAAAAVPTYDSVFSISLDRHSPSEGHPSVMQYDQTSVGSVNSIRRPVPARVPSDASSNDPQGLKRSGSNGSDHSAQSSSSTARTYAVAGSHHAIMAAHQHQNSTSSRNNAKRDWVIE